MDSNNLTEKQLNELFGVISRYLSYQHDLIVRLQANNFPAEDPIYLACRESVMALRELYLTLNDDRRKGVSHRAQKRAKSWPAV